MLRNLSAEKTVSYEAFMEELRTILVAHNLIIPAYRNKVMFSSFMRYLIESLDRDLEITHWGEKGYDFSKNLDRQGVLNIHMSYVWDDLVVSLVTELQKKYPRINIRIASKGGCNIEADVCGLAQLLPGFSSFLDANPSFDHHNKFDLTNDIKLELLLQKLNSIARPKKIVALEGEISYKIIPKKWFYEVTCSVVQRYEQQLVKLDRPNFINTSSLLTFTPLPKDLCEIIIDYADRYDEQTPKLRQAHSIAIYDFGMSLSFDRIKRSATDFLLQYFNDLEPMSSGYDVHYENENGSSSPYKIVESPDIISCHITIRLISLLHPWFLRDFEAVLNSMPPEKIAQYQKECGTYQESVVSSTSSIMTIMSSTSSSAVSDSAKMLSTTASIGEASFSVTDKSEISSSSNNVSPHIRNSLHKPKPVSSQNNSTQDEKKRDDGRDAPLPKQPDTCSIM